MSRRALVTGSLGFVGRVLTRRLREAGWEVLGTDLAPEAPEGAYRQCDLTDREQVHELVAWA